MNAVVKYTMLFTLLFCSSYKVVAQQNVTRGINSNQAPIEAWTSEAWTGDDSPYKATRDRINVAVANKQTFDALIQQSREEAQKNRYDPKVEYKYAYASYRAAIEDRPFNANRLIVVRDALQRGFPPHVYDYTRLRFLVESILFPNSSLVSVGKRLFGRDPEDTSVKNNLIRVLMCSASASDRMTATSYAQELVRTKPKNADYHGTLAGAYLSLWFRTRDKSYVRKAIDQYQSYLTLAPPDAEYRKTATRLLKTLQPIVTN